MKPGNHLIALEDAVQGQNSLGDFHDNGLYYSSHLMDEYYYDANGNMTSDLNRNLRLQYGLIHNMPVSISFNQVGGGGGGGEVEIVSRVQAMPEVKAKFDIKATTYSGNILNHYTWQGRKLGKKVYNDQGTLTLDEAYYGELTLSFGLPSRIMHADGYVDVSGLLPVFYYHLKDHLGNVRSVITPGTGNQPEIVQAIEYFPFGMSFESSIPYESEQSHMPNKHKYNSKEEQEMPGKWLDYGFRFYDSQIARFHSVDPLAHSFPDQSPYVYAANNPISFIDFMGLSAMSDISTRRASSFTLEMNNEQWMNATRPAGIAGVESNEKTKKTDKKTESQSGQKSTNGKEKIKNNKNDIWKGFPKIDYIALSASMRAAHILNALKYSNQNGMEGIVPLSSIFDNLKNSNTLQNGGIKINQAKVSIDGNDYTVQIIIPLFNSVSKGKFLGTDVQLKGGYNEVPFNNGWYRNYNPGSYQIAVFGKYKYQSMMNWLDYK